MRACRAAGARRHRSPLSAWVLAAGLACALWPAAGAGQARGASAPAERLGDARAAGPASASAEVGAAGDAARPWRRAFRGRVQQVSVAADGSALLLDHSQRPWLRKPGTPVTAWLPLAGRWSRVAIHGPRLAWALDEAGQVHRYNGTWWRPMGRQARDFALDPAGNLFEIDGQGRIWRRAAGAPESDAQPIDDPTSAPHGLRRLAAGAQGDLWALAEDGSLMRRQGGAWARIPGQGVALAIAQGRPYLVGPDGGLRRADAPMEEAPLIADVADVAGAGVGLPWVVDRDGQLWAPALEPAAAPVVAQAPLITSLVRWQRVPGRASQVVMGADGEVLALTPDGSPMRWMGRASWLPMPGRFVRLALGPGGQPWGIDTDGQVRQWQPGRWSTIGVRARDIALDATGGLWGVDDTGQVARWDRALRRWQVVEPRREARRLAIDATGMPWAVDAQGGLWRLQAGQWQGQAAPAIDELAFAGMGALLAVDREGQPWRLDLGSGNWLRLSGAARSLAGDRSGRLWATDDSHAVRAAGPLPDEPRRPGTEGEPAFAPVATAERPGATAVAARSAGLRDDAPLIFQRVSAGQRRLAIGPDGSVMALDSDGRVLRWSNATNAFRSLPGLFLRLALDPHGLAWAIDTQGAVWRHDGLRWWAEPAPAAQDLAIGADGTVVVVDTGDALWRHQPNELGAARFQRWSGVDDRTPPPSGVRVAVTPEGRVWTIARDGAVLQCEREPCTRLPQRAREIAIGPDGQPWVLDQQGVLQRWRARAARFEPVRTPAEPLQHLAVGPGGRPWVANARQEVWASGFFERDESGDLALAVAVPAQAAAGGEGVFTFSTRMVMDEITWTGGPTNLRAVGIGASGKLVALAATGPGAVPPRRVLVLNPATRRLETDPTPFPPVSSGFNLGVAVAPDNTIWAWQTPASPGSPVLVWRRSGTQWKVVPGLTSISSSPLTPFNIAFGRDGTVLATSPDRRRLFRHDPLIDRFVEHALQFNGAVFGVQLDPAGAPWVANVAGPYLHAFDGAAFQKLPLPAGAPFLCFGAAIGCFAIGAGGSVYTWFPGQSALGQPARWNAGARAWEAIQLSLVPAPPVTDVREVHAGSDGRLWVRDVGGRLYRAR